MLNGHMDGQSGWTQKDFVRDERMPSCHMDTWMDTKDRHRKALLGMDMWMDMMDGHRKTYEWT